MSTTATLASPLAIAHAYASAIANRISAPLTAHRERAGRAAAAYRARVAGDYVIHFLILGYALNSETFIPTAAAYARRAWREAVAALPDETN